MRVCWQSLDGDNCSMCEKCTRTMLELLSHGENPKDYNFQYDEKVKKNIKEIVMSSNNGGEFIDFFYIEIAKLFKKNKKNLKDYKYIVEKYKDVI